MDHSRYEPKRPVETGANVCNGNRHDQSMVKETWSHICQRTVGEHSLSSHGDSLRLVWTRMPGGVGAWGLKPPATRLGVADIRKYSFFFV